MAEPASGFAQQLRSLRHAQGLTVRALAGLVGVSKVTIWKWEKGDTQPRDRMIVPLAKALRIAPDVLRGSDGPALGLTYDDQAAVGDPHHVEMLADVITTAKQMIADASGANPQNITISIEY